MGSPPTGEPAARPAVARRDITGRDICRLVERIRRLRRAQPPSNRCSCAAKGGFAAHPLAAGDPAAPFDAPSWRSVERFFG